MPRYFIEVSYFGKYFSGFQIQENACTVQGEINKALSILLKTEIDTTTSSRTDSGVHALQNFLHFDTELIFPKTAIYNLNAIIHKDIVIHQLYHVSDENHSRFDALSREYDYQIIQSKDPFLRETSYFVPAHLDLEIMNEGANLLLTHHDFTSFCKRNTDVNNYNCNLKQANWVRHSNNSIHFEVESNRFLRGMVRAMVATSLRLGRGLITLKQYEEILLSKDCTNADFSAEAQGLFLKKVNYPTEILINPI